jgi:hypothetical protein
MPPWQDDAPAAAADDGDDDDLLSASSGSRSESPSPRTASLSSSLGAFALSPRAALLAAAAVDASGDQSAVLHKRLFSTTVAADSSNGGLTGDTSDAKRNGHCTDAALPADMSAVNGSPANVLSDIQPAAVSASADAASTAETATQQQSGSPALPPTPAGEALLPPHGLASLQASEWLHPKFHSCCRYAKRRCLTANTLASEALPACAQAPSKKARRVTWAAGVVSPRPRDRQRRRRRRRWLGGSSLDPDAAAAAAGTATGSFLLQCPPDDGAAPTAIEIACTATPQPAAALACRRSMLLLSVVSGDPMLHEKMASEGPQVDALSAVSRGGRISGNCSRCSIRTQNSTSTCCEPRRCLAMQASWRALAAPGWRAQAQRRWRCGRTAPRRLSSPCCWRR